MSLATIEINSHNITVRDMRPEIVEVMLDFCRNYIQFEVTRKRGRTARIVKAVYAASPINNCEIRVHRNTKDQLFNALKRVGYKLSNFNIIDNFVDTGADIKLKLKDTREAKDYQVPVISYILDDGNTKVVALRTGRGKTFVALKAIHSIGKRVVIIVPSKYVKKWIKDVESMFYLEPHDLLVIRGGKSLKNTINSALSGELEAKMIIITSTTFYNYIKSYENMKPDGFLTPPGKLFQTLKAGVKLIDECHELLHLNYKIDLYTHVYKAIFLSATLVSSDAFVKTILSIIYPESSRMYGNTQTNYIDVYSLGYYIKPLNKIKCLRDNRYSHVMFEGSLFKQPRLLRQYIKMLIDITKHTFINKRKPGQKMIIFASTVNMCVEITASISNRWPDLNVNKYTHGDPISNITESDIAVSTLGSAGTAIDIIDLKTCLLTVSIDSMQKNIQVLGRLRELVNYPGDNPEFYYLYCLNLRKQYQYHERKQRVLNSYCRSFRNRILDVTLD